MERTDISRNIGRIFDSWKIPIPYIEISDGVSMHGKNRYIDFRVMEKSVPGISKKSDGLLIHRNFLYIYSISDFRCIVLHDTIDHG